METHVHMKCFRSMGNSEYTGPGHAQGMLPHPPPRGGRISVGDDQGGSLAEAPVERGPWVVRNAPKLVVPGGSF